MIRNIYHGSSGIIRSPKFGAGNAYNDYGIGFYCTDSRELAAEWAVGRGRNGFVNGYRLDDTGLRTLDLNDPQYCILHWLGILLNYREFDVLNTQAFQARDYIRTAFGIDHQSYDIIVGYRADNSHFALAQDFLNGMISYQHLRDAVRTSGLGRQYVLKSNRAFDRLLFSGYEIANASEFFPAKVSREYRFLNDRCAAIRSDKTSDTRSGLFIRQFLDEKIRSYDPRLQ